MCGADFKKKKKKPLDFNPWVYFKAYKGKSGLWQEICLISSALGMNGAADGAGRGGFGDPSALSPREPDPTQGLLRFGAAQGTKWGQCRALLGQEMVYPALPRLPKPFFLPFPASRLISDS